MALGGRPHSADCALTRRLEAQHQALVTLWHQLHVDMKSLLAWQSLSRDLQLIRSWSLVTVGVSHGALWGGGRAGGPSRARRPLPTLSPRCRLQFRTLKPEEQRQALRGLELHYQAFLRDSQDASSFGPEDRLQAERDYGSCSRHYQQLLQSAEQGRRRQTSGGGPEWWELCAGGDFGGSRAGP